MLLEGSRQSNYPLNINADLIMLSDAVWKTFDEDDQPKDADNPDNNQLT